MSLLKLDKVSKEYKTEAGSYKVLTDISIELNNGEFVVVLGQLQGIYIARFILCVF